jgi:hypothetical protein
MAVVAVPEATVHKDDSIVSPEHQIGAAREVGLMKSKAVAKSVYEAAHDHLGRVFFERMRDIFRDRCSGVCTSVMPVKLRYRDE